METIECKDVTKIIKKNKVIDHLSLTLHAGADLRPAGH